MSSPSHWQTVYQTKDLQQVSWYAPHLETSLGLIRRSGVGASELIADVGGGAGSLGEDLRREGFERVIVLDLAHAALATARLRDTDRTHAPWRGVADARAVPLGDRALGLWHDRAVFHFLNDPADRGRYVDEVARTVRPGGQVVVATFGPDGPTRCSGLMVSRYAAADLSAAFGPRFALVDTVTEDHRTPSGAMQSFVYCHFRRT